MLPKKYNLSVHVRHKVYAKRDNTSSKIYISNIQFNNIHLNSLGEKHSTYFLYIFTNQCTFGLIALQPEMYLNLDGMKIK